MQQYVKLAKPIPFGKGAFDIVWRSVVAVVLGTAFWASGDLTGFGVTSLDDSVRTGQSSLSSLRKYPCSLLGSVQRPVSKLTINPKTFAKSIPNIHSYSKDGANLITRSLLTLYRKKGNAISPSVLARTPLGSKISGE